jgi:RNA polymerase sigma factor (sigma-70 family)
VSLLIEGNNKMEGRLPNQENHNPVLDSEFDLVQKSQARDKIAFGKLVDRYRRWLYAIALSQVWNVHDAEDIVQESLIRVWFELPRLKDTTKFRPWVAKIVVNRCRNWRREFQRKLVPISDLSMKDKTSVEQTIDPSIGTKLKEKDIQERFAACMELLPKKYKAILSLRYISNCSVEEISETLQISKRAVQMAIFYGRRKLRIAALNLKPLT